MATHTLRDALYYPYIHIRPKDIDWLKATLLWFPKVRRIAPSDFAFRDDDLILPFRKVEGARGPLLDVVRADAPPVFDAHARFKAQVEPLVDRMTARFGYEWTVAEYGNSSDDFQIDARKIAELFDFLAMHSLAWEPKAKHPDARHYFAVHPRLGNAILTVTALALAKDSGSDIVTSSSHEHEVLSAHGEDGAIQGLLSEVEGGPRKATSRARPSGDEAANAAATELAYIVLSHRLNVSKLTAEKIRDVQGDGSALQSLKREFMKTAAEIGDIPNERIRRERLNEAATEIVKEWKKYRRSLVRLGAVALDEAANVKIPEVVASGGVNLAALGQFDLGAGLILSYVGFKGYQIAKKFFGEAGNPYPFLSRVIDAGAVLASSPSPRAALTRPA